MAKSLKRLRREHHFMRGLLDLLERELALFDEAGEPDYDLLLDIADYALIFPSEHHHPAEDLLLARLAERDRVAADAMGDLESEHKELLELAQRFHAALEGVTRDVDLPRANFDYIARSFLGFYRAHIDKEEDVFLPAAERALSAEDWAEIDAEAGEGVDPFAASVSGPSLQNLRRAMTEGEERRKR